MQAVEMRFVRHQIVKGSINPAGTIPSPYGESIYRPPRGVLCYIENGTFVATNVAATRQVYLADGSASVSDAMTDAQPVGTPPTPATWFSPRTFRGLFIVTDALYLASTNIVAGEQITCRLQIAQFVPVTDDVFPSEFDDKHEEEPEEVTVVG